MEESLSSSEFCCEEDVPEALFGDDQFGEAEEVVETDDDDGAT